MAKPKVIKLQEKQMELQAKQQDVQIENSKIIQKAVDQGLPLMKEYYHAKMKHVESPKFKWSMILFGTILFICVVGSGVLDIEYDPDGRGWDHPRVPEDSHQ